MKLSKKTIADIVLIAALLLLAGVLYLCFASGDGGEWVVVCVDGAEIARCPLGTDAVYSLNGGSNILTVEGGRARVSEADCPDKLCVNQGWIRGEGQCIVCLPNKLTVTVEGVSSGVDMVA